MEDYTFCVKNIPPRQKHFLQNMMGDMDGIYLKYWAYSQSRYPKKWSNKKRTIKIYFGFLLHLLFHDYNGLVYDYNYNDVKLI